MARHTSHHILIVGATGQQGSSTIDALQHSEPQSPAIEILALTRSSKSVKAQQLLGKYPGITLVEGDVQEPEAIFARHPKISSIYLVTVPPEEESQALPLIDAAVSHGVSHIVFSSVDRGGDVVSWENATDVPHFASKHRIELHLREVTEKSSTRWTILRPTGFMDNYNPGFFGMLMTTIWMTMPTDCKMQVVSIRDIGRFAAMALRDQDTWADRAVALAGDELSFNEYEQTFVRVIGRPPPKSWMFVGYAFRYLFADAKLSMQWFENCGFGADIRALRDKDSGLQTFEQWLRQSSRWTANSSAIS